MDKTQALNTFWNSFGWPAFNEQGDYDKKDFADLGIEDKYIMYEVQTGDYTAPVALTASLYHYSASWEDISRKAQEIADAIGEVYDFGAIDGGYLRIYRGNPFAQPKEDPNDPKMRRVILNISAFFLTAT